jgi:predicted acetyltransferase
MSSEGPDGYGPVTDPADVHRLGAVLSDVFGFPAAEASGWFSNAGQQNLRIVREGGEIVGGLLLIPMAQFWGGRSVGLCGVAGVGTAPQARGKGSATRMMAACLRELRAQGHLLAALYPATQPLYRRVGFEQAGARVELKVAVRDLPSDERALCVTPFRPTDARLDDLQRLYGAQARTRDGWLDRGTYVWNRVQQPRGMLAQGYLVGPPDAPEGYVFFAKVRDGGPRFDLHVTDLVYQSPRAARRILALLADHASLANEVTWFSSAQDPLLLLLAEQRARVRIENCHYWMLRLLDVPAALQARGFPPGLSGRLELEVEDELLEANAGRWTLEVAAGRAQVQPGGGGALRGHVRALAPLYSGHRSATELCGVGLLEGTPQALEAADALFAGRAPSMPDMF